MLLIVNPGVLMSDTHKTKTQLIEELAQLRDKIKELENNNTLKHNHKDDTLGERNEMFNRLAENAKDMIYRMSLPDGRYEYVSPASLSVFGCTPEELINTPKLIEKVIHPDWIDYFNKEWKALLAGNMPPFYEYQIIHQITGKTHWVHQRNVLIRDDDSNPVAIEGIVTDTTESKKAEALLKERDEHFASLMNNPSGYAIYRMKSSFDPLVPAVTHVSPSIINILGLSESDSKKFPVWFRNIHPDDKERVIEGNKKVHINPFLFDEEFRYLHSEKGLIWLHARSTGIPYVDDPETIEWSNGIIIDITEQKKAEEELRKSEEKFRGLVESSSDWIWEVNAESIYTYSSPQVEDILGYSAEEIIGKSPYNLMTDAESKRVSDVLENIIKNNNPIIALENENTHKDGRSFILETNGVPFYDENGNYAGYRGVDRDITERKLIEEALKKSEERYQTFIQHSSEGIYRLELLEPIDINLPVEEQIDLIYDKAIVRECNLVLLEMYGTDSHSDILGKSLAEFVGDRHNQVNRNGSIKFVKSGYRRTNAETFENNIHGEDVWFSNNMVGIVEDGYLVRIWGTQLDITDRKKAEEALKQSEEKYRLLAENLSDVIWLRDMNLRMTYITPSVEAQSGFTVEEKLVQPIQESQTPESLARVLKTFKEEMEIENKGLNRSHNTRIIELEIYKKDGSVYPVESKISFVRDGDGKAIGILGINRDISERKQAEQLQEIQLNNLKTMDKINHVIHNSNNLDQMLNNVIKEVRTILKSDRAWLLYPCDPDSPTYRVPVSDSHPDYPGIIDGNLEIPMNPGGDEFCRAVLNSNEPVPFGPKYEQKIFPELTKQFGVQSQLAIAMYPLTGKPWMFGLHQCSHSRKWSENDIRLFNDIGRRIADGLSSLLFLNDLKESENKFRSVIEKSNDGIYILLKDGKFALINKRFTQLTGITVEEMESEGFNFNESIASEDREMIENRSLMWERGETPPSLYEFTIIDKENVRHSVQASVTEIDYENDKAILGLLRDLSDQKILEEQLNQSQKIESIGHLAGGIAHDFNNLLTPIIGSTELAMMKLDPSDDYFEEFRTINETANRAGELTKQLLAFSRKQVLKMKTVDMNRMIENFRNILRRTIREDIKIVVKYGSLNNHMRVDISQFEQILMNLFVNAQDAMPTGGTITVETDLVELDDEPDGNQDVITPGSYIMLSITDTGEGMDEETIQMIFDPFFTTKDVGKGTGLGLSTVYGIVKQHGGNTFVESEIGSGSTFKLYFPTVERDSKESYNSDDTSEEYLGSGSILLVEDQDEVRKVAARILESKGYAVYSASNGMDALALVEKMTLQIDLLLTDVVMPKMNGRELHHKMDKIFPGLKVLYMSGYTKSVISKQGILEENINFIQKPLKVDDLAKKVKEVIEG
jgi:two-component system, cell cycle sensor histidine kinase and response regulator CckA